MIIFIVMLSIVQASALGGSSVLSFISRHLDTETEEEVEKEVDNRVSKYRNILKRNGKKEVLIIAVEENKSAMKVTPENLLQNNINANNDNDNLYQNVVYVRSYAECAGVLAAHKAGILLSSITANVPKIKVTRL